MVILNYNTINNFNSDLIHFTEYIDDLFLVFIVTEDIYDEKVQEICFLNVGLTVTSSFEDTKE